MNEWKIGFVNTSYLSRVKGQDAGNRALGVFLGVDLSATRARMYRALLEGLCFETRKCFEKVEELKLPIHHIVASGRFVRYAGEYAPGRDYEERYQKYRFMSEDIKQLYNRL